MGAQNETDHLRELFPVDGDLLHSVADELRLVGVGVLDGAGLALQ